MPVTPLLDVHGYTASSAVSTTLVASRYDSTSTGFIPGQLLACIVSDSPVQMPNLLLRGQSSGA
jgi:hypothetical protein